MKLPTICFLILIISISLTIGNKIQNKKDNKNINSKSLFLQIKALTKQATVGGFSTVMGIIDKMLESAKTKKGNYETLLKTETDSCSVSDSTISQNVNTQTAKVNEIKNNMGDAKKKEIQDKIDAKKNQITNGNRVLNDLNNNLNRWKTNKQENLQILNTAVTYLNQIIGWVNYRTVTSNIDTYWDMITHISKYGEVLKTMLSSYKKQGEQFNGYNFDSNLTELKKINRSTIDNSFDWNAIGNYASQMYSALNFTSLDMQNESLDTSLSNQKNVITSQNDAISNYEKELINLNKELANLSTSSSFSSSEYDQAQKLLDEYQASLSTLRNRCTTTKNNLNNLVISYGKDKSMYEKVKAYFEKNYSKLTKNIQKDFHEIKKSE